MSILGYMIAYENERGADKRYGHLSHFAATAEIYRFESDAQIVLAAKRLESPSMHYEIVTVSLGVAYV